MSSGKKEDKAKPSTHKRRVSIVSASPPRSVSPPHPLQAAKRRSTMNSRDAAYEEEVKAALEASRLEAMGQQTEDEDRDKEDSPPAEGQENDKGKRKLEDTGESFCWEYADGRNAGAWRRWSFAQNQTPQSVHLSPKTDAWTASCGCVTLAAAER